MTTTGTYQGLPGEKNSSRVLRPPGGGSNNIFGVGDEPAGKPSVNTGRDNNIFGPAVTDVAPPPRKTDTANTLFGAEDSPSKQKATATYNPITGEETTAKDSGSMHTSTRVRQPPGGASSKLW